MGFSSAVLPLAAVAAMAVISPTQAFSPAVGLAPGKSMFPALTFYLSRGFQHENVGLPAGLCPLVRQQEQETSTA
jgi:hypothetical protein